MLLQAITAWGDVTQVRGSFGFGRFLGRGEIGTPSNVGDFVSGLGAAARPTAGETSSSGTFFRSGGSAVGKDSGFGSGGQKVIILVAPREKGKFVLDAES